MVINIIGDELWGRIIYLNNLLLYYELQSHYVYSRAITTTITHCFPAYHKMKQASYKM